MKIVNSSTGIQEIQTGIKFAVSQTVDLLLRRNIAVKRRPPTHVLERSRGSCKGHELTMLHKHYLFKHQVTIPKSL